MVFCLYPTPSKPEESSVVPQGAIIPGAGILRTVLLRTVLLRNVILVEAVLIVGGYTLRSERGCLGFAEMGVNSR